MCRIMAIWKAAKREIGNLLIEIFWPEQYFNSSGRQLGTTVIFKRISSIKKGG